jgi:hypothetical protein
MTGPISAECRRSSNSTTSPASATTPASVRTGSPGRSSGRFEPPQERHRFRRRR